MGPSGLVCALLLAACCCCRRAAGVPGEAEPPTPEPLEVEVGGTALLKCGPSHSPGNFSHVDWFSVHKEKPTLIFRVRKGQGQSEPGEYQHRLSLLDRGTTLALAHVTPHDERIFLCQGKRPQSQEHRIQLRVYKAPEEPTIQINPLGISVNSEEPEEVATCVGRNGYPVPQVIWYKNGRPLKEEKKRVHIQSSQIVESSGLYTLQSVLKAQLVKEDKDAQFYCELNYRLPSGNHMKESREVVVPVFYPAEKVWLEVEPVGVLKEGDRVEIRCLADGNPPPHFTISKQNPSTQEMEEKATEDNGVLVLESARKEHSGLYQCQGLDLETMASLPSEQQELLVNYVSDVRVSPAAPESREGGSLALTCEAESNRALEFQWLREKTGQVLEKGPVLRLHNLQRDAGGGYRCVASVPGVPGLNRTQLVRVAIFGSPWMTSKERKMWVKENTVLNLSCEASGHPRPSISWSVDGTAHEQDQDPQSVLSVLNVLVTPELLETGAECVASNFLGRNTTTIFLELDSNRTTGPSTSTVGPYTRANSTSTEKKLPEPESKGVAIVAVTVCVLVLAVLGAVLYFFYKKGKLPCGRSGKQEITLPPSRKSEFVVEVKSDKLPEEMGLLQGSTGDKRAPGDQGEKYIDLRH
ncbi:LOW QUALITY PROTEIN: cell surface glycoprotein MUC18 [Panthera pardus]|uniref:Cell surface glycoprotein MUC18 n=1 Tax=Panthera pardus TaxID=9691 RepID=A0A9V1GKS2_PANPR|nr:LOW QUALITY PROTEIN: cell surface glycoprotein MUC18 [Panthera pardus]XP_042761887.1 cell surface glycoprotein MUC18 isoform X2 [Panthera leo]